jgi:hypothetical protein
MNVYSKSSVVEQSTIAILFEQSWKISIKKLILNCSPIINSIVITLKVHNFLQKFIKTSLLNRKDVYHRKIIQGYFI